MKKQKSKSRLGTRAQIKAIKEREKRLASAIFLAIFLIIILLTAAFIYTSYYSGQHQITAKNSLGLKAAIVDQLSLTFPNQTFIEATTNILEAAGYTVDYFSGEKVTVELYSNLAKHGYKMVILRVHSSASSPDSTKKSVVLFTSERVSDTAHVYEQLTEQVVAVAYSNEDMAKKEEFFGIAPKFLSQSMDGQFQNCTIIMMGCEGLCNTQMAEAFVKKGAKAYIAWNDTVSAARTDAATNYLLWELFHEKVSIKQAVYATTAKFGVSDSQYASILDFFPRSAGKEVASNKE